MSDVKPVPDGYHTLTPYLLIDGAAAAIEFYKQAFGAEVVMRLEAGGGKIGHAEIRIGDSMIMMGDVPDHASAPHKLGGTPVLLHLYVPDADAVFAQAVQAGAEVNAPMTDQFYGDRNGRVTDPFGHQWAIATRKEDLTLEEIHERAAKLHGGQAG